MQTLEHPAFNTDNSRSDGLANRCRNCMSKSVIADMRRGVVYTCFVCGGLRSRFGGSKSVCKTCYYEQGRKRREAEKRFEPERILRWNVENARREKNRLRQRATEARASKRIATAVRCEAERREKEALKQLRTCLDDLQRAQKHIRRASRELTTYQRQETKQTERAARQSQYKYNALHVATSLDAPCSLDSDSSRIIFLTDSNTTSPLDALLEQEAFTIIVGRLMREKGLSKDAAIEVVKAML